MSNLSFSKLATQLPIEVAQCLHSKMQISQKSLSIQMLNDLFIFGLDTHQIMIQARSLRVLQKLQSWDDLNCANQDSTVVEHHNASSTLAVVKKRAFINKTNVYNERNSGSQVGTTDNLTMSQSIEVKKNISNCNERGQGYLANL